MATYTGSSGSYKTTLTVTETNYSIQNNTSTLSWSLKLEKTSGSGLWHSSATCPWSVSIPGSTVVSGSMSGSFSYDFRSYSSLILGSGTVTVPHNSDGTKTVNVRASVDMDNSDYVGVMIPSGSLTLTTIPRSSSVSLSSSYTVPNTTGTLSYSVTSKADFYHKATWVLGSTTTNITLGRINTTTSSFTITNTDLLNALPTSQYGTLNLTISTYSDSEYSFLIGSVSSQCTITITLKPSQPTLSTAGFKSRISGVNSSITTLTAGYTTASLTAWSHGSSQGATSYTTYFSAYYGSDNTAVGLKKTSATTANTEIETKTLPASSKQYTLTISAYTTDSRGLSSSIKTKTLTVYGYSIPTLNLTAYRVTGEVSDHSSNRDDAGTVVRIAYSNTLRGQTDANGSLRSNNQNAVISSGTKCVYGSNNTQTTSNPQWVSLSAASSLSVTYTVQDKFTTTSTTIVVPNASFPLDLYDNGSGNVGVGIGTVAQSNWFTSNLANSLTKKTVLRGRYATTWSSNHGATAGYVVIATITITGTYSNAPLWFQYVYRNASQPAHITIKFTNVNSTDPEIMYFKSDGYAERLFLYKSGTGTFKLISIYNAYDYVMITDVQTGLYTEDRVSINYDQSYMSALPDGCTSCSALPYSKALNADSATNATYTNWTETNTTTNGVYYIPFGSGYSTNTSDRSLLSNGDVQLQLRNGTTTAYGYAGIKLGNGTNQGTAGNKWGFVDMFPLTGNYYGRIRSAETLTANRTVYIPNKSGTLSIEPTTIWTGKLYGGNLLTDQNFTAYSRLRCYFQSYGPCGVVEVDLTHSSDNPHTTGYPYYASNTIADGGSGDGFELHFCTVEVNTAKTAIYNRQMGYVMGGSDYARNGSSTTNNAYYIYRIDGIL